MSPTGSDILSPVGGTVLGGLGGVTLLEEVHHLGLALKVKNPLTISSSLALLHDCI